jgi:hypothetical protein
MIVYRTQNIMPFKIQKGKSWNNLSKQTGDGLGKAAKSVGKGTERIMSQPFKSFTDFATSPSFLIIAGVGVVGLVMVSNNNNNAPVIVK